jgi:hypothetical protein
VIAALTDDHAGEAEREGAELDDLVAVERA